MISRELEAEILRLYHAEHWPVGTVAQQLHVHHSTVRRVLTQAGIPAAEQSVRRSMADPFLPFIQEVLTRYPTLRASRLYHMVRERGYPGRPDHFRAIVARHPESFRVDEGSIRLIERGKKLSDAAKVQLWQPFIAPSLTQLHAENRESNRSLGIIRPDPGSLKFLVKPAKDADAEDRQIADQVLQMQQSSFLEDPLTPLEKPEFAFVYRY